VIRHLSILCEPLLAKINFMDNKKLYLFYGIIIVFLGVVGFILTQAKSALISGLASGSLIIIASFFASSKPGAVVSKILNIALLAVFSWRSTLAIMAFTNGHEDKLVPSILLSMMALISVVVLAVSFLAKDRVTKDRI
jgi:uncharacterized membrane protein (UPF0136 family)